MHIILVMEIKENSKQFGIYLSIERREDQEGFKYDINYCVEFGTPK